MPRAPRSSCGGFERRSGLLVTEAPVRTVGEMLRVVERVLPEILTEEELAALTLRVLHMPELATLEEREQAPERDGSDLLDEQTLLVYGIHDDRGGSWMQGRESASAMRERFRGELQDFVAESAFGWGQWRP